MGFSNCKKHKFKDVNIVSFFTFAQINRQQEQDNTHVSFSIAGEITKEFEDYMNVLAKKYINLNIASTDYLVNSSAVETISLRQSATSSSVFNNVDV